MMLLRSIKLSISVFLVTLLIAACGASDEGTVEFDEAGIETSVALTQTSAALATVAGAPATTEPAAATFAGDLQPLDASECDELANAMGGTLAVAVEQTNVPVEHEGKTGGGCQATAVGTGENFADMPSVEAAMRAMLELRGWSEDMGAPACLGIGGWGPGANVTCFTQEAARCSLFVHIDPIDPALCSDDEPISVCFAELAAEQIIYTIDLACAQDTGAESGAPAPQPITIFFAPGDDRISVPGEVPAGGTVRYVLTAMAGQEMTVNLLDPSRAPIATDMLALAIWGADGTVLISSHADALTWSGELPSTQDYTIDVNSVGTEAMSYILEIVIPPPASAGDVFPKVEPFPFGEMQTIVFSGVPPMLPAEFPVEEGQPVISAYILTSDDGLYEISLDYGLDCQGAGACHYGSAAGMQVASTVPVGTDTFPFDLSEAQVVELQYGITGYFILGACGASCDDGRVWWVYGGYQYMLGLKAGPLNDVVALANAAILNSVP